MTKQENSDSSAGLRTPPTDGSQRSGGPRQRYSGNGRPRRPRHTAPGAGRDGHGRDGHGRDGHARDGHGRDGHARDGYAKGRPDRGRPGMRPGGRKGPPRGNGARAPEPRLDFAAIETEEIERHEACKGDAVDTRTLKEMTIGRIAEQAAELGYSNITRKRKPDIILGLLKHLIENGSPVTGSGVLELMRDGSGYLRSAQMSYLASSDDILLPAHHIRQHELQTGDFVCGPLRVPRGGESHLSLIRVDEINYDKPERIHNRVLFSNLTPLHPNEHVRLENGDGSLEDVTARIIDIIAPIGKGQRGLLVASPKAGKTVILQKLACRITENYPDCHVIVLLIDERPEEVTEMQRMVPRGEVVSSTFDEPASRHVQVAEMVIEKSRRLVECGKDVVILLDSITRLARAHNTVAPMSGRILSGGVDSNALHRPKRFFGAARNVEEGGSLTIIATALVETGSKMDEVIYEEFKGTGNMELHLERRIAEKRVYPAINIERSGTRREEMLISAADLQKVRILRKVMHEMDSCAATEFLINKIQHTASNADFFESMNRGG